MPVLHTRSLRKLIKTVCPNPKLGCEVGVWQGENSKYFLTLYPELVMYMVDSYCAVNPKDWNRVHSTSELRVSVSALIAIELLKDVADRKIMLICDSVVAAQHVRDESLDFVFLDAGHQEEDATVDCNAWYPKVRKGGLVSGHDYGSKYPGVTVAVDRLVASVGAELMLKSGRVWGFAKP